MKIVEAFNDEPYKFKDIENGEFFIGTWNRGGHEVEDLFLKITRFDIKEINAYNMRLKYWERFDDNSHVKFVEADIVIRKIVERD